jgi:PAS domain S-box-containing protein
MAYQDPAPDRLAEAVDPSALIQTLFDQSPFAFAIADTDGHCVAVNRAFRELFGSTPPPEYSVFRDELVAAQGLRPYFDRAFGGEPVVVPAFWYDAAKLEHVRVKGRRVAIELSMTPLADRGGAVRHIAMSYKDVTAEHQLADERLLLRTLFEAAPEAILISDHGTGRITDANVSAVRMFGRSRDELGRLGHVDLSPSFQPDGRRSGEAIADHVARARSGEPIALEWMYQTASGEPLPAEVRLSRVPAGDRVLCRVSIVDLRERKRAEAERERVLLLEQQNRDIQRANRHLGSFVAATSHDLRAPLNAIIAAAQMLYDGQVPLGAPEHREFTGYIVGNGRHLSTVIDDLLEIAQLEAGKFTSRPRPMDVECAIAEATNLLRALAQPKRIQITIEAERPIGVVELDPARFTRLLNNYLSNAIKFTPEGGRVVVRTRPEGPDAFRIEVEDSGVGIPEDQIGRLFTEFEQLETGATKLTGTGLGLAVTRRQVEAQGGSVGVTSVAARGSVFYAVLPRKPPASSAS